MPFHNYNSLIASADGYSEKIKIYNYSGSKIDTIDCDYKCNYHSEAYYLNDKTYILMSCKPGIILYDYSKKSTKFKLTANNDYNVKHYYSTIEKINNELIILMVMIMDT